MKRPRRLQPAALTVRRRLVIGVLAILAVLIAAVGAAQLVVLRHALYDRSAQGLRNELMVLASTPQPSTQVSSGAAATGTCSGLHAARAPARPPTPGAPGAPGGKAKAHPAPTPGRGGAAAVTRALAAQSIASAIAGPEGTLLTCAAARRTGDRGSFSVPASLPAKLAATTGYVTLNAQGHHLLAVSQPLGRDQAILVTDIADDDSAVGVVLVVIVLGALAALAAAGALMVPLLRAGLAPLRRIAGTADAIAGGDLDQRADLERSADEVGQLGAAFDRMVDQLQRALVQRDTVVEDLRARDQVMRRFIADASHELRTPLTAIRGGAQVLRLGSAASSGDLSEALGHIQAQTERMSRLIEDLLTLSRQDAGQPAARRELIDLGALVAEHHRQWAAVAPGRPIRIDTQPASVIADADALLRACANLVENAEKYSPAGTEISLTVSGAGGRTRLAVIDHGPGIPVAERARVFERFYRGDPTRSRATGGAGLGLAIVAGVVADHAGTVDVRDTPGGGATLVLDLPAAPPTERRGPDLAAQIPPATAPNVIPS